MVKEVIIGARISEADRRLFNQICKTANVSPSVLVRALVHCINDHGIGPGSYHIGHVIRKISDTQPAISAAERAQVDERTKTYKNSFKPSATKK